MLKSLFEWIEKSWKELVSGLLVSILASIIVILSQALVQSLTLIIRKKFLVAQLWRFRNPQKAYIVSGDIRKAHPDINTAILSGLDAEVAHRLQATIEMIYPKAQTEHVYSSDACFFAKENYVNNMIIIGGPVNNNCAKEFLSKYESNIEFYEKTDIDYYCLRFFEINYIPDADHDYAIIIRDRNPYCKAEKNKSVIIVAGCDSFGGLAASRILDYSTKETLAIKRQLRNYILRNIFHRMNYAVLVKCDIVGGTVSNTKILSFKLLKKSIFNNTYNKIICL